MPTDIRNIDTNLSSDATFRASAQAVHDALIAAGLVQTADTGQINLATATRPAQGIAAGYEIFRMADAQQATDPIFFKLEYGGANSSGSPAIRLGLWVTAGTGTDGAGNVIDASTRTTIGPSAGTTGAAYTSATEGGFFFNFGTPASTQAGYIGVQRIRNSDDAQFSGKWLLFAGTLGTSISAAMWNPQLLLWTGGVSSVSTAFWPLLGDAQHIGGNATDAAMCPGLVYDGQFSYFSMLAADIDDVTLGTPFTITMPEGSRTFMPLDALGSPKMTTSTILCIPWE